MKQISFSIRWKLLAGLLGAGSAGVAFVDNHIRKDINMNPGGKTNPVWCTN